ncbi:pilus assembly protein PilP [Saccharobesus litoralis]|uniref:Pilus assembly protein PilP n=1 Tax=Saccharobesus litoralis TaxID=2172099 RepID=A0A2S0VQK1_9ALTE|nr:pilus assembly protein PilP [Saccharobesus litoralis]AWB66491.1 pilus assembly protein PilP [Saccharobesus litoralis]
MIKKLSVLLTTIGLLSACGDDMADIQEFTQQVKNSARTSIEPIPKVEAFESFEYSVSGLRSPFVEPEPELIQEQMEQSRDCLQPNFARNKQPLEKYPLDNLRMRGTLGTDGALWGLIEAADGALFRVRPGSYMGLYHGRIVAVTTEKIELEEMIPDGTGCWEVRGANLAMADDTDLGS